MYFAHTDSETAGNKSKYMYLTTKRNCKFGERQQLGLENGKDEAGLENLRFSGRIQIVREILEECD